MISKRLVPGPRLLHYSGGFCDSFRRGSSSCRGYRAFHRTSRRPSRSGHEKDWQHRLHDAKPLFTTAQAGRIVRSPRTHLFFGGCAIAAGIFYFSNLESVPVSGRRRFNCYGDGVSTLSNQHVKRVIYEAEKQGLRILPENDPRYGSRSSHVEVLDALIYS